MAPGKTPGPYRTKHPGKNKVGDPAPARTPGMYAGYDRQKSADAKNTRLGAYARAHMTTNADGTLSFAKMNGGSVTLTKKATDGS